MKLILKIALLEHVKSSKVNDQSIKVEQENCRKTNLNNKQPAKISASFRIKQKKQFSSRLCLGSKVVNLKLCFMV